MQIKTVPLGKKTTNKPKPQLISVSLLSMPSFQAPPPARPGRRGSLTPNPELGFPHSHPELRLALLHPTARPSRGPHGQTEPVGPSPPLTGARHRRLRPNGRGHAPPLAPPLAPQVPPPRHAAAGPVATAAGARPRTRPWVVGTRWRRPWKSVTSPAALIGRAAGPCPGGGGVFSPSAAAATSFSTSRR